MSLLRRREMMENQEQEENVIYIDAGFLEQNTSTAFSESTYNPGYPNAYSSTCIPVKFNDNIKCDTTVNMGQQRVRGYVEDGTYRTNYMNFDIVINTITKYIRFVCINGIGELKSITVTHADGTRDTYKIIDRR